jgi:hypothetical protein
MSLLEKVQNERSKIYKRSKQNLDRNIVVSRIGESSSRSKRFKKLERSMLRNGHYVDFK